MKEYKIINPSDLDSDEEYLLKNFENCNNTLISLINDIKPNIEYNTNINDRRIFSEHIKEDKYKVCFSIEFFKDLKNYFIHSFEPVNKQYFFSITGQSYNEKDANILRWFMLQQSISFLMLHEFGHIYNGHFKYKYNKKNINNDISKILEINADDFASTQIVSMFGNPEISEKLNSKLGFSIKLENIAIIICQSITVALSMSYIGRVRNVEKKTYLPMRFRKIKILHNFARVFDYLNYEKNKFIDEKLIDYEVGLNANSIQIKNLVNGYLNEMMSVDEFSVKNNLNELSTENSEKYADLEKLYYNEISKELEKYSYATSVLKII